MATFNVVGFDEVEKAMLRRTAAAQKAVPAMLEAGAEVLVKEQKKQVLAMLSSDRSTGDLEKSIQRGKVQGDDTEKYIEVYPQGKNHRGERNATVGFVQEYGRTNMPARPWMTTANELAADAVHEAMAKEWEKAQNAE